MTVSKFCRWHLNTPIKWNKKVLFCNNVTKIHVKPLPFTLHTPHFSILIPVCRVVWCQVWCELIYLCDMGQSTSTFINTMIDVFDHIRVIPFGEQLKNMSEDAIPFEAWGITVSEIKENGISLSPAGLAAVLWIHPQKAFSWEMKYGELQIPIFLITVGASA